MMQLLLFLILQVILFYGHVRGGVCESGVVKKEIQWNKLHGTWYDVIDIPNSNGPLCWDIANIHPIENGVGMTTYEREFWHHDHSKPIQFEFFHADGGFYTEVSENVTQFLEEITSLLMDWKKDEKPELINKENDPKLHRKHFFLTDYENYFIIVFCLDPGFRAFVKSSTPSVDMEFIDDIDRELNEVGLKSPTMTLKIGCLRS